MIIVIFPEQEGNKYKIMSVASNVFNLKFIFTFNSQDLPVAIHFPVN